MNTYTANPALPKTSQPSAAADGATPIIDRVLQGAHETIDKLADQAAPHLQDMKQGVEEANEAVHEQADHLRELSAEWVEALRSTVREHPVAAVATALAAGMLIARLLQSNR